MRGIKIKIYYYLIFFYCFVLGVVTLVVCRDSLLSTVSRANTAFLVFWKENKIKVCDHQVDLRAKKEFQSAFVPYIINEQWNFKHFEAKGIYFYYSPLFFISGTCSSIYNRLEINWHTGWSKMFKMVFYHKQMTFLLIVVNVWKKNFHSFEKKEFWFTLW